MLSGEKGMKIKCWAFFETRDRIEMCELMLLGFLDMDLVDEYKCCSNGWGSKLLTVRGLSCQ